MALVNLIPHISISPAPPEDPHIEPFSPFTPFAFSSCVDELDGFRSCHLTPPPTTINFKRPLSHLRPAKESTGRGLESQRFQAILKASRERNVYVGVKKEVDFRKEIALKVHKNKQAERRALFLSKVQAPPSPTATVTPKTPPDSPSVFHYSLPSPGLVSPLALFETLGDSHHSWVEQVDFRLCPDQNNAGDNYYPKPHAMPSLDQISARLIPCPVEMGQHGGRISGPPTNSEHLRPSIGVGRLKMPLRVQPLNQYVKLADLGTPGTPWLRHCQELQVTTLVVPRTQPSTLAPLTEKNLNVLNSRDQRACNMLSTLRRRTSPPEYQPSLPRDVLEEKLKYRRHSAPADIIPSRPRSGFEHPVLALPGGF